MQGFFGVEDRELPRVVRRPALGLLPFVSAFGVVGC